MFDCWPLDVNKTLGALLALVCLVLFVYSCFHEDSTVFRKRRDSSDM